MKKQKKTAAYTDKRRLSRTSWLIIGLAWLIVATVLAYLQLSSSAQTTSTARIYVTPASGTFNQGATLSINVQVALNNNYNAAATRLFYDHNRMQYLGTNFNPAFNGNNQKAQQKTSGSARYIDLADHRTSGGPLRGTNRLATVRFRARANGSAFARTASGSVILYPTANYSTTYARGTYTIRTTPPPPPPPPAQPTPHISSVSPNPVRGSSREQPLTLNGRSFASNATITLRNQRTGKTYTNRKITSRSATRLVTRANFSTRAANWTAQVVNPGGKSSAQYRFRVAAPPASRPPARPSRPPARSPRPTTPPRSATPRATIPRTSSQPSSTKLQITKFNISHISYRSARLTWRTNRPATSVVSYGTSETELSTEKRGSGKTTSHTIVIDDSDILQAGKHYFVKAMSQDDGGPVSVTGEFDTKPVTVIITVTNTDDTPLAGATVYAGDQTGETNENGEVSLNLPEGNITVTAQKDELYRELDAFIEVPVDANTPAQRVTLNLGELEVREQEADAPGDTEQGQSVVGRIIISVLLVLLLGGGVFWFLRRRAQRRSQYDGDILEAERYTQPTVANPPPSTASMPPTTKVPSSDPIPHHASLSELVKQKPVTESSPSTQRHHTPEAPTSPTGQTIQQHTSLKDLVQRQTPPQAHTETPVSADDLPVSPVAPKKPPATDPPPKTAKKGKSTTAKPGDGEVLTIEH